jgi:zinc transporter
MNKSSHPPPSGDAPDGIVSLFTLDNAGGGTQLHELPAQLPLPFWLHVQSDHAACPKLLQTLGASPLLCESMTTSETRPRVLVDSSGVLVLLRGVNMGTDADPEDMVSLRIWLTPEFVVTARKSERRLLSVQDVQNQIQAGTGPQTPQDLVVSLVTLLAERIGNVVNETEDALTDIEANLEHLIPSDVRPALTQLRRRAARLKRYLAPQRDALEGLNRLQNVLNDTQSQHLREQSDRTTRYVEDLELARELAILLQEELRNRIAEQQNERMYVLSLVAAIFLPLSFLTGVFGMNVLGLPGVDNPRGFFYVSSGMLVLGIGVAVWMWRRRWL